MSPTPLPVWLRYARSIYWASWAVCMTWPFYLFELADALGMQNLGRHGSLEEVAHPMVWATLALGIMVALALIAYGRATAILVILSVFVMTVCQPAIGH